MKNILIVDNDLGFVFWLGEVLIRAKHQAWPACSVSDAIALAGRKPVVPLDVLIINPSLPGISRLLAQFPDSRTHLKVIALGSPDEKALPGVHVWRERPKRGDLPAHQWVQTINRLLSRHQRAA